MKRLILGILLCVLSASAATKLDIYWIDVEGGASTLIVTSAGETVLMDAGYAGFGDRDAKRIHKVLTEEAGAEKIDYFITSHFHGDHAGGIPALARRVPIGQFLDHGDSVDQQSKVWQAYLAAAGDKRRVVKPGDTISLTGAELLIVAAHSRSLPEPLPGGGKNRLCGDFMAHPPDTGENGKSTGYLLRSGEFEFLNLGDLSWNYQAELACPVNLLGEVDLFQVTHHGVRDDVVPQQMWSVKPTVAVMNNGPRKGAGPVAVETVMKSPGLEDLWQLHRAAENDAEHNTAEALTANLTPTEGCAGHWIHASLSDDGSYTLTNSRTGHSRTYRIK